MKNMVRFSSALVLALAVTACSDDEDSSPTTGTASNQPAAGSGGSSGSANAGTAGSAGAPTTSTGGSSAEAPDDDIDLQPGDGDDDDNAGGITRPSAADAGASAPEDGGAPPAPAPADAGGDEDTSMSFFVTSVGGPDGGNFGGIEGADVLCQSLAAAVSPELGAKTWRAYLSTTTENARDRIGDGPWFNQAGVLVATDVDQLHDQAPGGTLNQTWAELDANIALDELGNQVPFGGASGPVQHDILTGTLADGTVATDLTCGDWTLTTGTVQVGHSNRDGGGEGQSWNSAHANVGCAPLGTAGANVGSGGGRGSVYCFAAN